MNDPFVVDVSDIFTSYECERDSSHLTTDLSSGCRFVSISVAGLSDSYNKVTIQIRSSPG